MHIIDLATRLRGRWFPIPVLGFVLVLGFLVPASMQGAPAGEIVLDDLPWPPYYLENGEGYLHAIFAQCLPRMGATPSYAALPIQRMWNAIESGDIDLHVMSHRKEREKHLVYGKQVIFTATYRPVVRSDSPIVIQSIADFKGLRIGTLRGLRLSGEIGELVDARNEKGELEVAGSEAALLRMLDAGRIDAAIAMSSAIRHASRTVGLGDRIRVLPWVARQGDYYFVVPRASKNISTPTVFLGELEACVDDLENDGSLAPLRETFAIE